MGISNASWQTTPPRVPKLLKLTREVTGGSAIVVQNRKRVVEEDGHHAAGPMFLDALREGGDFFFTPGRLVSIQRDLRWGKVEGWVQVASAPDFSGEGGRFGLVVSAERCRVVHHVRQCHNVVVMSGVAMGDICWGPTVLVRFSLCRATFRRVVRL